MFDECNSGLHLARRKPRTTCSQEAMKAYQILVRQLLCWSHHWSRLRDTSGGLHSLSSCSSLWHCRSCYCVMQTPLDKIMTDMHYIFSVHGVGGLVGMILAGFFARGQVHPWTGQQCRRNRGGWDGRWIQIGFVLPLTSAQSTANHGTEDNSWMRVQVLHKPSR